MISANNYSNAQFPKHNINPEKKDDEWLLKFAKAAWGDSYGTNMFYHARDFYSEYRDYAYGRQGIDRYKPFMGVDKAVDTAMWNVSWETRPVISKYMDIITSIIMNKGRKAIATPIDAMAQDEADKYFSNVRAKILMRNALQQVNPELAQSPYLLPEPGEPENLEELEMQMEYGFKFNMAMEAEQGIELVQYQNNLPQKRLQVTKDLVQLGVGGYKDWLDENGQARFRDCDPANVIMSYCRKADFSDKIFVGEIIEVPLGELAQYFNDEELKVIEGASKNNPISTIREGRTKNEKLKIPVLELEILTWNDLVYSRMKGEDGEIEYKRRSYENITNPARVKEKSNIYDEDEGDYKSKYFSKKVECWYKVSWVIDTDYCYNTGKVENQKRPKNNLQKSESSYHFQAVNFKDMTSQGIVERLKPIVDEYQLTIFKIQDFKNKWLPYIMEIDLDAIESVAIGAGGTKWTPERILDLVFQTRALVVRKKDISGINVNYKALEVHPTGMAAELVPLMNDLTRLLQEMNDVTGLNPVTDATGSGERKLKSVAQMEYQATNNALEPLMFAEKMLFESLSKGCIMRLIQAVKRGQVSGVMTALGGNTVKFIQVSPDISLYSWGIKIQDVPTEEDVQLIMQQMGLGQAKDLFRPQDIFMIKSCENLKQMEMRIGYLYEKRYKEAQSYEMGKIQQTIDGQQKSAIVSEQAKQQTLQIEYALKKDFELTVKEKEKELLLLKLQYERGNTLIKADADLKDSQQQVQGKVLASSVAAEGSIEKQRVANEKPVAASAK